MLLPLTGAVLVGVVLGSFFPYLPLSIFCCLLLLAILFVFGEQHGWMTVRRSTVLYGGLLAGVLIYSGSLQQSDSVLANLDGQGPVRVAGTVIEPPSYAPNRTVLVLAVSHVEVGTERRIAGGRLRVTWREPDRMFLPGDHLVLTARVHPPSGTLNPGGFNYGAYLVQQGIDAVASVSGNGTVILDQSPVNVWRWGIWRTVESWRNRIRHAALVSLSDPAAGVFLGIIIGEQGYLSSNIRDVFMATGTIHILSISGSHLGLVALLSFFFVKGVCRLLPPAWVLTLSRRLTVTRLAAAVTIIPVTFYAVLAGAEVATMRSLLMIVIFLLAVWLGRERDVLLALACAALVLVLQNPRACFDISFQLSFVSVLAIALVLRRHDVPDAILPPLPERDETVRGRIGTWLREYGWLTGGVTLATLPLVAYYFKQIAWLGLIANLFVVPLAGLVVVPLGLISSVWLLLFGGEYVPMTWGNEMGLQLMIGGVQWLAKLPGAEWHVASPAPLAVAVYYIAVMMAMRPVAAARDRWTRAGCVVVLTFLIGWWLWSPRVGMDGDSFRVTFLDVGQGDASVVELPDGQTVVIDAGARYDTLDMGRAVVGPFLWDRGIKRLNHVIGTHPQLDHVGGLPWLLHKFPVGHYWHNGIERHEPLYEQLRAVVQASGVTESQAQDGREILDQGPCRLHVLSPPASPVRMKHGDIPSGSNLNNLSVITRLDCGSTSVLFTADAEVEALARLVGRRESSAVDVVKVPHHGAKSSLSEPWIAHIGKSIAVISVGRHNAYGHPAAAVEAAYRQAGASVFRTDRDGAVWVMGRLSTPGITLHTATRRLLQPISLNVSPLWNESVNWVRFVTWLVGV